MNLQEQFGNIDVYLFDQLLRGRLRRGMRVLDAGCGGGRNLVYLLREGFEVHGVDSDAGAIAAAREMAAVIDAEAGREGAEDRFQVAAVEALPYPDGHFDFVICNALLHFARDEGHFTAMASEMARVLRPGGTFFARLMSTVGVEDLVRPLWGRNYQLPGGQRVFLVDEALLIEATQSIFHGRLADPLKSTVVHGQRTMTTWVAIAGSAKPRTNPA